MASTILTETLYYKNNHARILSSHSEFKKMLCVVQLDTEAHMPDAHVLKKTLTVSLIE